MTTPRSAIVVGNFDGVHLGHQALVHAARDAAAQLAAHVVVLTFRKHPMTTLRPDAAPLSLMDADQRRDALLAAGADRVEWLQPDEQTLGLTARQFVEMVVARFAPVAWVEGPTFRFGRGREGDNTLLQRLGGDLGFDMRQVERVTTTLRDKTAVPISSSLVRWLAAAGRMTDVQLCCARPLGVRGPVVIGEQRGRTIGYPTINLDVTGRQLPRDGVYGGRVNIDGREFTAAISVGTKPTFPNAPRTFEAFILDFDGDLYGRTLEVRVLRWLRDQAAFASVDSLCEQMARDVQRLRELDRRALLDPVVTLCTEPVA